MKLQIDNLDGGGARDYSSAIDSGKTAAGGEEIQSSGGDAREFGVGRSIVCCAGQGRPRHAREGNGTDLVYRILSAAPAFEYLGWGERGPVYRYDLLAQSDETILSRKRLPYRCPFVARSAGDALRRLTQDLQPAALDTSGVQSVDVLAQYLPDPQMTWAQHAAAIALEARGSLSRAEWRDYFRSGGRDELHAE